MLLLRNSEENHEELPKTKKSSVSRENLVHQGERRLCSLSSNWHYKGIDKDARGEGIEALTNFRERRRRRGETGEREFLGEVFERGTASLGREIFRQEARNLQVDSRSRSLKNHSERRKANPIDTSN
ncbi:hypothetical protein VNO77_22503 [Canavalia gladiata]|uniref:Uncharacterized protein n=1 Tax=Canavalia gladiata TaxID=3824 RepID=A0AAN9QEI5_CANGL